MVSRIAAEAYNGYSSTLILIKMVLTSVFMILVSQLIESYLDYPKELIILMQIGVCGAAMYGTMA